MTHNEYTNKYSGEIGLLNRFLSCFFREAKKDKKPSNKITEENSNYHTHEELFPFLQRIKEEALRAEFMSQYEGRELSDRAVTEDGRVV